MKKERKEGFILEIRADNQHVTRYAGRGIRRASRQFTSEMLCSKHVHQGPQVPLHSGHSYGCYVGLNGNMCFPVATYPILHAKRRHAMIKPKKCAPSLHPAPTQKNEPRHLPSLTQGAGGWHLRGEAYHGCLGTSHRCVEHNCSAQQSRLSQIETRTKQPQWQCAPAAGGRVLNRRRQSRQWGRGSATVPLFLHLPFHSFVCGSLLSSVRLRPNHVGPE